ncbi:hypothetical protein CWATWH0005_5144 [Crocosphaera watsonii WH 0005]|uniref:Uncharacterized protein n=1 Tax=Crocosphaera watsonii WH 0005 TaxID=423472 RepID=T2IP58_CROWT|nr:hypothetical protein CWATWH0005_5144 [Crocosphaera watsonii WH 0005]
MGCLAIAKRTLSGTGVGPGIISICLSCIQSLLLLLFSR